MSIIEKDIVVVGGGPVGLLAARKAAELGKNVLLLESKEKIGQSEHCAGLLSIDGLKELKLTDLPPDVIQNKNIIGSRIYSPSGKLLLLSKESATAWVVNRAEFNIHLSTLAEKEGVTIQTSSKVIQLKRKEDKLILKLGKKKSFSTISSKLAILAEGRFPKLNQQLGLTVPSREKMIFASMYIMSNVSDIDTRYVEIYQNKEYSPGFFAWIIPIDETTAKVGLGSKYSPASKYLDGFIKHHPIAKKKLENSLIEKRMSGAIPLGSFIRKTYTKNALVVGDAASQTKPTTGGGVILGGIAAQIAGKIASEAIDANNITAKFLSKYETLWQKEMKRNLTIMKHVRYYLNSLNAKDIEKLISIAGVPRIRESIAKYGDVDNQKIIVYKLFSNYKFWPFLVRTGLKYLFLK